MGKAHLSAVPEGCYSWLKAKVLQLSYQALGSTKFESSNLPFDDLDDLFGLFLFLFFF